MPVNTRYEVDPSSEIPSVPEVGDIVRVYPDNESIFYVIGEVMAIDEDNDGYVVRYPNNGGELKILGAKQHVVELSGLSKDDLYKI